MRIVEGCAETIHLKKNQYYALMVKGSNFSKKLGHTWNSKFKCYDAGLERASNEEIYISKEFGNRYYPLRGRTVVVEVDKNDKVCLLK